jgi:hypothetical protein
VKALIEEAIEEAFPCQVACYEEVDTAFHKLRQELPDIIQSEQTYCDCEEELDRLKSEVNWLKAQVISFLVVKKLSERQSA